MQVVTPDLWHSCVLFLVGLSQLIICNGVAVSEWYLNPTDRLRWQIAMASGWESEGPASFKPRGHQATFDPGCQKN